MERPTDELLQRLLAAVASAAGDDAARLVGEARAEAESEVKDIVKTAIKAVLLRRAVDHLGAQDPVRPTAEPQAAAPRQDPALRQDPRPDAPATGPTACYVYAIARSAWGGPPPELPGIDRRWRLRTVGAGDLQAVVSDVSLDEFGPAALEERLKELPWVEEKVRAHDAAVKALSAVGTVIPCRFCTILAADDDARAALARHHDAIVRTLEAIDGKTEWGVKLLADTRAPATASAAVESAEQGQPERESPSGDAGRAYLAQKQRGGRRREEVLRAAAEAAEACHRALFSLSADAALLPTRDRGSAARGWHLALNAAYLVPDSGADAFRARVEALAREYHAQGLRLDLTGPWPPYNFAALDLSGAPPA
jgi:hypothetical protein